VNGFEMKTPALLMRVSTRPKLYSAVSIMRSDVAGSARSPLTASTPPSPEGSMVRALATTQPASASVAGHEPGADLLGNPQ
jgi:hypothetical protein